MLNITWSREQQSAGFSLLELMIVVAIVAILAAVAVPGYYNHMVRSRQSAVIGELMSIKAAQERYFADNGAYAGKINKLDLYAVAGTYSNGDYEYWVEPNTNADIQNGTIWALGDPNRDGAANDRWKVSIDELSAKPEPDPPGGSEGFSWSSLEHLF
jgi:prepilin-type N-terminal cleavage/methylation domain-containing protein